MLSADGWQLGHRLGLDGLRGVAIALVVIGHVRVPGMESGGWAGVTLFFVLSGFLITSLLLEERLKTGRIHVGRFYARRAIRLLPALVVFLIVVGGVRLGLDSPHAGRDALAVAFYVANWVRIITGDSLGPFLHTWSLAIEEQFYIVWPGLLIGLLALGRGRRTPLVAIVLGAALASAALRLALWNGSEASAFRIFLGTDTRADALIAGVALAVAFHSGWVWAPGRRWIYPAIAGLLLLGMTSDRLVQAQLAWIPLLVGLPLAAGCGAVLVAAAATHDSPSLTARPLTGLGRISYALYLWHLPIIEAAAALGLGAIAVTVGAPLVAALVAAASYRLIEQPFLRLRSRVSVKSLNC